MFSLFKKEEDAQPQASHTQVHAHVAQLDVDVYQSRDAITIVAQVAGINLDTIAVGVEGNDDIVIIEGEREAPTLDQGGRVTHECTWGPFYRRIILPHRVAADAVDAEVANGVLLIILPFA